MSGLPPEFLLLLEMSIRSACLCWTIALTCWLLLSLTHKCVVLQTHVASESCGVFTIRVHMHVLSREL